MTDVNVTNAPHSISIERLALAFSAVGTFCTVSWVLWFCRYGIDFTDESFYLLWISNPFNYSTSVSQFGFVYHPLYELLGGNIASLRQANVFITFGLAWVLCDYFLKSTYDNCIVASNRIVISAALATTSLLYFSSWLLTPSYNSLAFQALLIATIGLVLSSNARFYPFCNGNIGAILIGIGGWAAFMAKPTTAAALALATIVYALISGRLNLRLIAISVITAACFLALSALMIDESILAFFRRIEGGIEVGKVLGGGHTFEQLLRLDVFFFGERNENFARCGVAVLVFVACWSQSANGWMRYGSSLVSVAMVFWGLAILFGWILPPLSNNFFQGLLICIFPIAAVLTGLLRHRVEGLIRLTRVHWGLFLCFLTLPHAFAFGTSNNYWVVGSGAAIFWVLACLPFMRAAGVRNTNFSSLLLPFGIGAQFFTVAMLVAGIEAPYRQIPDLRKNSYEIDVGKQGSSLVLSQSFGHYFADVQNVANRAGFLRGTPMIDLTGQFPGTVYALGASAIGQAWMLGGYPGSNSLAEKMLAKVSCEQLAIAWLLVEPENPGRISTDILTSFGESIATDFVTVGVLTTPEGTVGHMTPRAQQILKPIRAPSVAASACEKKRAQHG